MKKEFTEQNIENILLRVGEEYIPSQENFRAVLRALPEAQSLPQVQPRPWYYLFRMPSPRMAFVSIALLVLVVIGGRTLLTNNEETPLNQSLASITSTANTETATTKTYLSEEQNTLDNDTGAIDQSFDVNQLNSENEI